jgi:hypothetical protein
MLQLSRLKSLDELKVLAVQVGISYTELFIVSRLISMPANGEGDVAELCQMTCTDTCESLTRTPLFLVAATGVFDRVHQPMRCLLSPRVDGLRNVQKVTNFVSMDRHLHKHHLSLCVESKRHSVGYSFLLVYSSEVLIADIGSGFNFLEV